MSKSQPENYDIVPVHLAVTAMRDNGYKNAAYAIAELVDNSIQAGAKTVELLCSEQRTVVGERVRSHIDCIALLDDGGGMNADELRNALQFGNGSRLETGRLSGMGRFGMGLKAASISQCKRLEVWSWQAGCPSAIYSYLDLDEVTNRRLTQVPKPLPKEPPPLWRKAAKSLGKSGTLVVWSNIDRCAWRSGRALIENSAFLFGRMYRRFINEQRVQIRMVAFDKGIPEHPDIDEFAQPNDPMYLLAPTSTPAPWANDPMFQTWGEPNGTEIVVRFREKDHKVRLRFACARPEARPGRNPGDLPHGKHAKKNIGLSVVRAGRELELEQSWVIHYDPVERWWGAELEFEPGLDELFGVANNKQHAHAIAELGALDLDALAGSRTVGKLAEDMRADEDPRGPLLEIKKQVESNLNAMRRLIKAQSVGKGRGRHHDPASPEAHGTKVTRNRQKDGHAGASDPDEALPPDTRVTEIEKTLEGDGVTPKEARELAAVTVEVGLKYVFATADMESSAFFSVKPKGGSIIILLNSNHPAHKHLIEALDPDNPEVADVAELTKRLATARDGLKLLLEAWARYEDEQPDGSRRKQAQDARLDWGRMAEQFLRNLE